MPILKFNGDFRADRARACTQETRKCNFSYSGLVVSWHSLNFFHLSLVNFHTATPLLAEDSAGGEARARLTLGATDYRRY